jgi:uncharacterized membrane protein
MLEKLINWKLENYLPGLVLVFAAAGLGFLGLFGLGDTSIVILNETILFVSILLAPALRRFPHRFNPKRKIG